ncbi:MAG: DUF421 domain-containing protein [Pseudomonadota bacterium]|nr:DUF421 domain-containing protein [Pseudomonadota bacterium]
MIERTRHANRPAWHERCCSQAMFDLDWEALWVPSGSLVEIAIRGTVVYLALFLAMRFLPRRELGGVGPADILVIVIIADAVQEAMAGGYQSITEGLLLAAVIFAWATAIDWLDYRFPQLRLAEAKPKLLISKGRLLPRNMRRDRITEEEVLAQLRQHGVESPSEVEAAYIEGNGHFSVLTRRKRTRVDTPGAQG